MPLATGQVLQNRYRIASVLGRGGMGAVYRAWHLGLDGPVAVKEMVPEPGMDPALLNDLREQFRQEARILMQLKHHNLVSVYDYFIEGGNAYLVMELVEGENLAHRVERLGPLPESEVWTFAEQILDALSYCHRQGVVHRDIKPQNIIVRPSGDAVLVDFGLVKLWDPYKPGTRTVMRGSGTPGYAPLEQYATEQSDSALGHTGPWSDVYSLGATLYCALTGQAPPTPTERLMDPKLLRPPAAMRPGLSPQTEAVLMRALEVAPAKRLQDAGEMQVALAQALHPKQDPQRPARKVPVWMLAAGGGLILCALGSLLVFGILRGMARQAATPPRTAAPALSATPLLVDATSATTTAQAQSRDSAHATATRRTESTAVARATTTAEARATGTVQAVARATATAQVVAGATATAQVAWTMADDLESGRVRVLEPQSADLVGEDDGFLETDRAGVELRDFVVAARVRNPSADAGVGAWSFCLGLRDTGTSEQYRLVFRQKSLGVDPFSWKLWLRQGGDSSDELDAGWVGNMNPASGDANYIRLIVSGEVGLLFVNDEYVTTLDLSAKTEAGDVFIATECYSGQAPGLTVHYEDWTVWELP